MPRARSGAAIVLFLLGLFSQTQIKVVGYMDISEAICYLLGPLFFVLDWPKLRQHGFGPFLGVWFLALCGAMFSNWYNDSFWTQTLRGMASPISVLCITCVFHHYLSKDFKAFKWFFLGAAISYVISVFVFQRGASIDRYGGTVTGEEAVEGIITYSLFWLTLIATWLLLPIQMFYLKTPKWYSISVGLWFMTYGIFSAGSRSSLLVAAFFLLLIIVAGKTRESMMFIKKHFVTSSIVFVIVGLLMASFYRYAAVNQYLGEDAYKKYMEQTQGKSGIMTLIRGGRSGFFIGLEACLHRPFVGWGAWAKDTEGFIYRYIHKYGTDESLKGYDRILKYRITPLLPSHSYVISFWLWHGLGGLVCMLYVGWLYFSTLKNRMHIVPELYGYFAFALPTVMWAWFFSPFGARTASTLLMVLCLFVKAIEQRRFYYISDADMTYG